jgi:ribonuclease P/MRP protein subunit POP5
MAKIKPSQREKKRYIVFEIGSEQDFSFKQVKNALIGAILRYIGQFGLEKTRIYVIKNMYMQNRGIFRITNKSVNDIKMIIPLIKDIEGKKATMKIIGISGILKKAKNKFLLK